MAWYDDLRPMAHDCGQPLLVGDRFTGYQLAPVFQIEKGRAVVHCPRCGHKLNLNDCQPVAAPTSGPTPAREPLMS